MTTEELKARIAEAADAYVTSTPDGTTLVVKYIIEPEQATELKDGGTPMLCGDW